MAVTLGSTGITFPDATTQTTAATASTPPLTTNVRQAVTSSATTAINFASGNTVDLTMAANITTMTFSGVASSGTAMLVQIVVKNASSGTAYTIVWPTSVYWNTTGAFSTTLTAPTLATGASGVTVISLLTTDGGTKWRGWVEATIPGGALGALWTWGTGSNGRLGLGTGTSYSSPVQVGALTDWSKIDSCGNGNVAVKNDGTLWTWGYNYYGTLGLGGAGSISSPSQIGSNTNWVKAVRGSSSSTGHSLAITSSGSMFGTGYNSSGQLGKNNKTRYNSWVSAFTAGSAGSVLWSDIVGLGLTSLAVSTTGALWSVGNNVNGVLGLGNTTSYSTAKQVGALTNWATVARVGYTTTGGQQFTGAIKTDGTLWTWGLNSSGQLGLNNLTTYSSPVQVGALTNWKQLTHGVDWCAAVKTDGTLWGWGANGSGQLGLNNKTAYSSPKQIGALTTWAWVRGDGNSNFTLAAKTDGTLWAWGTNTSGQLGINNGVSGYSSPKQIGSLTTWGTSDFNGTAMAAAAGAIAITLFSPA